MDKQLTIPWMSATMILRSDQDRYRWIHTQSYDKNHPLGKAVYPNFTQNFGKTRSRCVAS